MLAECPFGCIETAKPFGAPRATARIPILSLSLSHNSKTVLIPTSENILAAAEFRMIRPSGAIDIAGVSTLVVILLNTS